MDLTTGDRTLVAGIALDAGSQITVPFASGSDSYVPGAPTALQTLDDRSLTFIETFGPDRVWVWDVVDNRVREAADLTPQIVFQLPANRAELSGLALTPCTGSNPPFTVQPRETSVTSCVGGTTELRVLTSTPGPFRYVWKRNGTAIDQIAIPSAGTASLSIRDLEANQSGTYTCVVSGACGSVESQQITLTVEVGCCDSIDFNRNTVFPEDQDVIDFFNVLAGADCPYAPPVGQVCDIDFNNNTVFPEDQDVIDFFTVLAGGECS
ncbi:MAG TPA: immunoglobulin domain-containing protein [Phycisphaerales bacterium]|nr:immunoglobulin domain-containing protein [Phycisphaerales bacterium]